MKINCWTYFVRVVLILCAVILAGVFFGLQSRTIVNLWTVVVIASITAVPISFILAAKDSQIVPFSLLPIRMLTWLITIIPILCGTIYAINYTGADRTQVVAMTGHVEKKYYKNRQHNRRVGRGRYIPTGKPYRVYYADIRFDNGHDLSVQLKGTQITRIKEGRRIEVKVADGLLGIPVVFTDNIFNNQNKR